MTKTELLKDLLRFQISRYNYRIVGNALYFILPNNNFAVAKLLNTNKPNDFNGISITCINVPFGEIDTCELLFSDIFYDENTTTIIRSEDSSFRWFKEPTHLDKLNLSDHIGKYFEIISFIDKTSMFASSGMSFLGLGAASMESFRRDNVIEYHNGQIAMSKEPETDFKDQYMPITTYALEIMRPSEATVSTKQQNNDVFTIVDEPNCAAIDPVAIDTTEDISADTAENVATPKIEKGYVDASIVQTEDRSEARGENKDVLNPIEENLASDVPASKSSKKKGFWSGLFKRKDTNADNKVQRPAIDKTVLTEMKEAVKDNEIPEEKIFKSWDVSADPNSEVTAALKKTQDDYYELRIVGKGDMANINIIPWDEYAFNIQKAVVYDGVTSIGTNAFKSLKYMESVEIADSVTKIGDSAFEYCEGLTEINLPKKLVEIGEFAFAGCDGITTFILPDSLRVIHDYAFDFDRMSSLTVYSSNPGDLTLGDGIEPSRFLVKKQSIQTS